MKNKQGRIRFWIGASFWMMFLPYMLWLEVAAVNAAVYESERRAAEAHRVQHER